MSIVVWLDEAEDQLGWAYLDAREYGHGRAFTQATERIEKALKSAPATAGESRSRRQRVLVDWPISVTYEFHEAEDVAVVLTAHFSPPRRV
jgi:hypothetical protein